MRLLVATGLYPPEIGGPATYARILERELPRRDIEVSVYPFRAVRHLPRIVRHGAYCIGVVRRARGADLILALDPVSVGLPSMIAAKLMRKRFFVKIVGDYAWEQYMQRHPFMTPDDFQNQRFDAMTEMRRFAQRIVARAAERVIVPSEYLKKIIALWGVPRERITVVYNAFEPPAGAETREEIRAHLGLSYPTLVSVGRLVPWKGFAALIDVMPEVVERYPSARLYIIGDGPEYWNLEARISKSEAANHIIMLGSTPHDEVPHMLKGADVFVLNTGYEGLSHVLLEALSLGVPVVTTPSGGNAETVADGVEGLIVPYNDHAALLGAILKLLGDESLRRSCGERGREKARSFSLDRMIRGTIAALRL